MANEDELAQRRLEQEMNRRFNAIEEEELFKRGAQSKRKQDNQQNAQKARKWVIGAIFIAAVLGGGLALTHKSNDDSPAPITTPPTTTTETTTSAPS